MTREAGSARAAAASVVDQVLIGGRTLDRALQDLTDRAGSGRDMSQIKALAFGSLRWHHRHRLIIDELLERPLRDKDSVLEALLSVGLFQLINPREPEYATVSETVEASRRLRRPRAAGMINATLRRFQREREDLLARALSHEEGRYAHPEWFIEQLREDWPSHWQAVLEAALAHPPMWIRVNGRLTDRDEYAQRLRAEAGIDSRTLPGFADALCLERPVSVSELPGFDEGLVSVQDAASQLAADLLAPEPGMRVLDACAAPGGKAGHLLERTGGQIDLVTVDVNADRNRLLEENLGRLRQRATVVTGDACLPQAWAGDRKFDRILVDAPCSATGVIRRHPDIKFLRRPEDIDGLAHRQNDLLETLWTLLKPGGRLLYATCSVIRQENDALVANFLERHPEAREVRPLPGEVLEIMANSQAPGEQLLPGAADTDGFYYALMEYRVRG
jgi:16S rRNA (cytosine967-C5)-methyltransferase